MLPGNPASFFVLQHATALRLRERGPPASNTWSRASDVRTRAVLGALISDRAENDNNESIYSKDEENICLANGWWTTGMIHKTLEVTSAILFTDEQKAQIVLLPPNIGLDETSWSEDDIEISSRICSFFELANKVRLALGVLHLPGHYFRFALYSYQGILQLLVFDGLGVRKFNTSFLERRLFSTLNGMILRGLDSCRSIFFTCAAAVENAFGFAEAARRGVNIYLAWLCEYLTENNISRLVLAYTGFGLFNTVPGQLHDDKQEDCWSCGPTAVVHTMTPTLPGNGISSIIGMFIIVIVFRVIF
jgi:hypothetical protein